MTGKAIGMLAALAGLLGMVAVMIMACYPRGPRR